MIWLTFKKDDSGCFCENRLTARERRVKAEKPVRKPLIAVIQAEDNAGLDQFSSREGGERWSGFGCVLKVNQ